MNDNISLMLWQHLEILPVELQDAALEKDTCDARPVLFPLHFLLQWAKIYRRQKENGQLSVNEFLIVAE